MFPKEYPSLNGKLFIANSQGSIILQSVFESNTPIFVRKHPTNAEHQNLFVFCGSGSFDLNNSRIQSIGSIS